MNIKSLLLGSAAALVAVSGARAADAIVTAEPEPAEYVRVCDVYGKGYFYIPGTETCLKVSGLVRYQYNFDGNADIDVDGLGTIGGGYEAGSAVRAELNFDAREETELGTLRGFIRLRGTNSNGNAVSPAIHFAYMQLGGFTAGFYDSLWTSDIGGAEDGLLTDTDLVVGDNRANLVSYTYAADALTATLSLENPVFSEDGKTSFVDTTDSSSNFDVVAKVAYSAGWGGAYVAGVYDSEADTFADYLTLMGAEAEEGYAVKVGAWFNDLGLADSTLKIEGHYAPEWTDFATTSLVSSASGESLDVPLQWTAGLGYSVAFGKASVAVAGRYGQTFDDLIVTGGEAADVLNLVGNVGYSVTDNLSLLSEVRYENVKVPATAVSSTVTTPEVTADTVGGFLRLQRNF